MSIVSKSKLKNLSAEASLLGVLLTNPKAIDQVAEHVTSDFFVDPKNASIYSAICAASIDKATGLAAVVEQLRKDNTLTEIGEGYLYNLTKHACSESDIRMNVAILKDLYYRRDKAEALGEMMDAVVNGTDETVPFDKLVKRQSKETVNEDNFVDLKETMTNIISGNYTKLEPTILKRSDGKHLLYAGKLNWLAAPPEAMKSFTMLLACIQEMIDHNRPVVYVDFEDDQHTVSERLYKIAVGMGLSDDMVLDMVTRLFHYIPRGKAFEIRLRTMILKVVQKGGVLVIIDGCATAMALANLNENDNSDVNKWISSVCYPLTNAGAAVVVIDHVVKNNQPGSGGFAQRSARGAGSKLAAVSGTALIFDVKEAGGAFTEGKVEITVSKDRPGRVLVQKRSGKRLAGVLMSKPVLEGREGLFLNVHPAEEISQLEEQKRYDLVAAEHISRIVHELGPVSKTEVRNVLKERFEKKGKSGFRSETIAKAMLFLTNNSYIRSEKENRADMLTSLVEYKSAYGDKHADDIEESPF